MLRSARILAAAAGLALLASCGGPAAPVSGGLDQDPDFLCLAALTMAGGAARTNGDAAAEDRIVHKLHYYMGRLSSRRPDDKWRTAWQDRVKGARSGDVAQALKTADDCSSRMVLDFSSH